MRKAAIMLMILWPPPHPLALVNPYDPQLGGINCMDPCDRTANGLLIRPEHYGRIAACPPVEMGCWVTFSNEFGSHGPYQCNDTGGALLAPQVRDGRLIQLYDVLWDLTNEEDPLPWWNHGLFEVAVECYQ